MKIALAALQLKNTEVSEVVKISGLTRRLKNWLRSKIDDDYSSSIAELRSETDSGKILLKKMYTSLNAIQEAISDGDVADYEANFNSLKKYIQEFLEKASEIKEKVKDYYTKEEMDSSKFNERVKSVLPPSYNIEIEKIYNQPLKNFEWYKNIDQSIISTNPSGAEKILINKIAEICIRSGIIKSDEIEKILKNKDEIIKNFKNSIVEGNLIKIRPFSPSKTIKQAPLGRMELYISTAPFEIPEIEQLFQGKVLLVDLTIGQAPIKKISVKAITHLQSIGKKTSKLLNLFKKAFDSNNKIYNQLTYKVTNLTEVQLAQILRKGYQNIFGKDPSAEILAGAWAQIVLEAGRPVKLPNNNFGNIKAENSWITSGKPFFLKDTGEFDSKGNFYKEKSTKWKAFSTPEEGAEFYWKFLQRKHPQALEWMAAQDPISATITLGLKGYFTANIKKYANGINGLYQEFMQKIYPKISGLKSTPIQLNKEKPQLKEWASLYSKDEIKNIFGQEVSSNDGVSKLINKLISNDKLTKLVKNAMLKKHMPKTIALTKIIGSNYENNLIIAKNISNILVKHLDSSTIIFRENDNIEIQSKTLGYPITVTGAIQNICDCIKNNFEKKYKDNVIIITAPNIVSLENIEI